MSKSLLENVEKLIEPILDERNLSLFDLEFVRERNDHFLRVYIDKKGGVDLDECSIVSEKLSEKLDEEDLIKGSYYLEVSSPGAERPLKTKQDLIDHIGENVFVCLYVHIDGEKQYEGTLLKVEDDIVTIEYKFKHTKKQVEIPYDKIAKARLAVIL
ncbi:MAG TPA: ribosome maturation factor RimP [Pseudogracilibacillus sp.]|nr:ribosome maturation factor RimP [Pseudogracilibacillus sp.]